MFEKFRKTKNKLQPPLTQEQTPVLPDEGLQPDPLDPAYTTPAAPITPPAPVFDEPEEVQIAVPPVEKPFWSLQNHIACLGFSQQGESHKLKDLPCQDRCRGIVTQNGYVVMAIADGVGSCALSDLGSAVAVQAAVGHLQEELEKRGQETLDAPAAGALLREAMNHAYDMVEQAAEDNQQLLYSLQSTLTVAIYDGTNLYYGHAGDDGIVALTKNGILEMVTIRHKGEEASSVYPLQNKATWEFKMVPDTVAFVMATDGVLDAFVRNEVEKNRIYYPFIEPLFTTSYRTEEDVRQMCQDFYAFMESDKYRTSVTDDLTLMACINQQNLQQALPVFDMDAWNAKTKEYDEQRYRALYGEEPHVKEDPSQADDPVAAPDPTQSSASAPDPVSAPDPWVPEPQRRSRRQKESSGILDWLLDTPGRFRHNLRRFAGFFSRRGSGRKLDFLDRVVIFLILLVCVLSLVLVIQLMIIYRTTPKSLAEVIGLFL